MIVPIILLVIASALALARATNASDTEIKFHVEGGEPPYHLFEIDHSGRRAIWGPWTDISLPEAPVRVTWADLRDVFPPDVLVSRMRPSLTSIRYVDTLDTLKLHDLHWPPVLPFRLITMKDVPVADAPGRGNHPKTQ